jgi:excisionase family DNA binding protein
VRGGTDEEDDVHRIGAYCDDGATAGGGSQATNGLPNRLMTAFEVAEFIGCHEETVRRAYLRGLLTSQRFGVRGRRFHPADVLDWIRRGAPTRVS